MENFPVRLWTSRDADSRTHFRAPEKVPPSGVTKAYLDGRFLRKIANPARASAFVSAIMAPQPSAAQHILIKSLLEEGFENKPIASEASCRVRAVQRIRLKQFELPTPRTNRVGRRSCVSPMQKALCEILIEQPYPYRCEMADSLYRRFCKRISDRSIGRIL
jgi:hypothetical protein